MLTITKRGLKDSKTSLNFIQTVNPYIYFFQSYLAINLLKVFVEYIMQRETSPWLPPSNYFE